MGELFGKRLPEGNIGESWEISAHPQHVSRVAEGPLCGQSLDDLCTCHANELIGSQRPADGRFPLLIKLLDCRDWLSVQVHPTDEIANRLLPGERGKTEAWVILEADAGARIYAGFKPGTTQPDLEGHLTHGTVERCLHSFAPRPGDCLFLPAGTVHAVGGGVVMAEVQQSSDATFRLFDWNRVGADGQPRALHLREALESIDWQQGPVRPIPGRNVPAPTGARMEHLVHCRYFTLDRFVVDPALELPARGALTIWMMVDGVAELQGRDGSFFNIRRGQTILLPASGPSLRWQAGLGAPATLLRIALP